MEYFRSAAALLSKLTLSDATSVAFCPLSENLNISLISSAACTSRPQCVNASTNASAVGNDSITLDRAFTIFADPLNALLIAPKSMKLKAIDAVCTKSNCVLSHQVSLMRWCICRLKWSLSENGFSAPDEKSAIVSPTP